MVQDQIGESRCHDAAWQQPPGCECHMPHSLWLTPQSQGTYTHHDTPKMQIWRRRMLAVRDNFLADQVGKQGSCVVFWSCTPPIQLLSPEWTSLYAHCRISICFALLVTELYQVCATLICSTVLCGYCNTCSCTDMYLCMTDHTTALTGMLVYLAASLQLI